MEFRRSAGRATLRHHDAVLGWFRRAGFSLEMTAHAYALLDAFRPGYDSADEFELGLDLILDGLAAAADAER